MRKSFLLAAFVVVACSKEEAPAVDSIATATPPAPAALTAADVAGSWTGTIKEEGTDSVTSFTTTRTSDSTGVFVPAGSPDSIPYAVRLDADSMIVTSVAYADPSAPKGSPEVMFRSVGRLKDGKLVGTGTVVLASKPDSVVSRSTWEATRVP
ncbi:MAG TPA: hypothetical protein VFZ21_07400 [Gemmatimonadaceae bacterium]|jgi:hypothetical protein|nr:hypothetical protein [Gemmatimonadaceae bacterium]